MEVSAIFPLKWDGHTHTNYCRHGSDADMGAYVEEAIARGFRRYTLSEHPPLPERWIADERLMRELAMKAEELPHYFADAFKTKEKYREQIEVLVGLELDYLPGNTDFALEMVDRWNGKLEDALVSVHYLPGKDGMRCVDFTPADFAEGLIGHYGSMEAVVDAYYDQVEEAVAWAAQLPVPKRIGHINLIEKFQAELPAIDPAQIERRLRRILPMLKRAGAGLDVNTAGLRKKTCGKPYVPAWYLQECLAAGIPVVFGSDAHHPHDVGSDWDWFAHAASAVRSDREQPEGQARTRRC